MVDYPVAKSPKDERVTAAAALWLKKPGLSCAQIMLASKFNAEDSHSHAKQMWIRRRAPTKKSLKKPTAVVLAGDATSESTLTMLPKKTNDPPSSAPVHPILSCCPRMMSSSSVSWTQ